MATILCMRRISGTSSHYSTQQYHTSLTHDINTSNDECRLSLSLTLQHSTSKVTSLQLTRRRCLPSAADPSLVSDRTTSALLPCTPSRRHISNPSYRRESL